jgi:hypothetical protein
VMLISVQVMSTHSRAYRIVEAIAERWVPAFAGTSGIETFSARPRKRESRGGCKEARLRGDGRLVK